MKEREKARLEARAGILKALAHPTRLFIIEELSRDKRCVNELTEMLGVDVSTVSKHLLILKNSGLVSCEKRGTTIHYSIKCPCVMSFFDCVEAVIKENADSQIAMLKCACRK